MRRIRNKDKNKIKIKDKNKNTISINMKTEIKSRILISYRGRERKLKNDKYLCYKFRAYSINLVYNMAVIYLLF